MTEASEILGVSFDLVAKAKEHPAFAKCWRKNGRCCPELIRPLLNTYRDELNNLDDGMSEGYWRRRKLKADALTSEIDLDEKRERFLEKDEVVAFLKQIASAQRAMLISKLGHELSPKLLGLGITEMNVILERELNEVLEIFQKGIDQWK